MSDAHTTNKLGGVKGSFMRRSGGPPVRRNKSSIFSSIKGARPTRNPSAQRRVSDLNKGEIWTGDDFDEPVVSVASQGQKRVAGLHRGAVWTSEDFDEPLPDEFWLGSDQ
jgi:hypothetical protein